MNKEPLLILHGAIGASDQFLALADELSNYFDVYLFEFSGHGQTPKSKNGFSISVFSEETAAYIETNFSSGINVFGYSMGGYVGLYLCKNYPNTIKSLCTLGTKWEWNEEIAVRESKMLNPEKIEEKIPAFAKILENRHLERSWKSVLSDTSSMMLEMGKNSPINAEDCLTVVNECLVLLGDTDEMVSIDESRAIVDALPNATFKIIENTIHPIEKVNIDLLSSEINRFFHKV